MKLLLQLLVTTTLGSTMLHANPYPDPRMVPLDRKIKTRSQLALPLSREQIQKDAHDVLRVQVDWDEKSDTFRIAELRKESSGTDALVRRSRRMDPLGSYKGLLRDPRTGTALAFDSLGTGQEFRRLTRALTFRFPLPRHEVTFELYGENPQTGAMEKILSLPVRPNEATALAPRELGARLLKAAAPGLKLLLNVYAEGYTADRESAFWSSAQKIVDTLTGGKFPYLDQIEIKAVFVPSNQALGRATNLGMPVAERDSFLGLYYPYWRNFGRWYNVVYPTREKKYRDGIGQLPYDYAIALIDSGEYWGVGNYKELTAIPAQGSHFSYLLTHEFGHFFGLNEEYEGGGATELAFAPGTVEPWSQNITFLRDPNRAALKWNAFVDEATPLPTPSRLWKSKPPLYGAYQGGYADTEPYHQSHKPGFACVMDRYRDFCEICRKALNENLRFDLGLSPAEIASNRVVGSSR